jgi:hypothetical protein
MRNQEKEVPKVGERKPAAFADRVQRAKEDR